MLRWARRLLPLGLALLFTATDAVGQRSCDLVTSDGLVSNQTNQARVTYVSGPRFECADGTSIQADSSVIFEATAFMQLFGRVIFREQRRELHADRAQYFSRVNRLQAQGSVLLTNLEDGSWVSGEDLVILEETVDRAEEEVTVREGRPHARLVPKVGLDSMATGDSGEPENLKSASPYEVDANLIRLVGDRLFQARGQVEITHESLQSYGDSVEFQQDIGWVTLFNNARVLSGDTIAADRLDLRGDTITMSVPNDQIDEMESRGRAQLLTDDVDMRGPVIRLAFANEALERVFAVQRPVDEDPPPRVIGADTSIVLTPPTQPIAFAEDFRITGDSIEADLLGGGLDRVVATGAARGVSTARDSLNTENTDELIRSDWIEGDTITATFGSTPIDSISVESDSSGTAESTDRLLDMLVATGEARSFYRSTPDSAPAGSSGVGSLELNYVVGDEVRLFMRDGEVDRMEVDNPRGVYLQPRGPSTAPPPEMDAGGRPPPSQADGSPPVVDSGPPGGDGAR
jgi:hypothetical protein